MRVSVGQAAANALALWLQQALTRDITVYSHWPEADVRLRRRVVSIVPVGRRIRSDAVGVYTTPQRTNISATQATVQFQLGGIIQPIQLDVWASSQDERDDAIAQLDDALCAGIPATLNVANSTQSITGDPMRDGLLLQMGDGFQGNYVDFWFDDASIDDDADAIQRTEYRAIFMGEARTAYTVTRTVPRLLDVELKVQVTQAPVPPSLSAVPYDTTTLTPNAGPPPTVRVTHGKSST